MFQVGVSHQMVILIVDGFETVQIHKQNREGLVSFQKGVQPVPQICAVAETGQGISEGSLLQMIHLYGIQYHTVERKIGYENGQKDQNQQKDFRDRPLSPQKNIVHDGQSREEKSVAQRHIFVPTPVKRRQILQDKDISRHNPSIKRREGNEKKKGLDDQTVNETVVKPCGRAQESQRKNTEGISPAGTHEGKKH